MTWDWLVAHPVLFIMWCTIMFIGSVFVIRWILGTQKLHEDMQKILEELKKISKGDENDEDDEY